MTLDEIAATLPNGFHDTQLLNLSIDYVNGAVKMRVHIWIGSMSDPAEEREKYVDAEIELEGLQFWVIGPPDPKYPYNEAGSIVIDVGSISELANPPSGLPEVSGEVFVNWMFVV